MPAGDDRRSPQAAEYRRWYSTARWRRIRAAQLRDEPLCCMCAEGGRVTPATVCDHKEPHRGDETKFFAGPFQSLCASHHSADKQAIERGGAPRLRRGTIGADGWLA